MNYLLKCGPLMIDVSYLQLIVPAMNTSAFVTGLHPGTSYYCTIFTVGPWGRSEPKSLTIDTPEAGNPST